MVHPGRYLAGSIYYVPDEDARLPGEEAARLVHEERRVVLVVSDQGEVHGTNALPSDTWPSVWVVPISSSTSYKTRFDVKIGAGEGNLRKKGWARVPALQVMDKDLLEDMIGQVQPETLRLVTAQVLNYLGVLPPDEPLDDLPEQEGF